MIVKTHPFLKNVKVSNTGKVFTELTRMVGGKNGKAVKHPFCKTQPIFTDRYGYHYICLPKEICKLNGLAERKKYKLHQLIAHCFIPNPENFKYIDHKDSNPKNNSIENLQWVSLAQNNKYSNTNFDSANRYTLSQKMLAFYMIKEGWNDKKISSETGIKVNTLRDYRKGRTGKNVQRLFRKEVH